MASDLRARVAEQIRVEMARRQLRGTDLAAVLGVSVQSVSYKLRALTWFSVEDLDAISRAWNVPLGELVGDIVGARAEKVVAA